MNRKFLPYLLVNKRLNYKDKVTLKVSSFFDLTTFQRLEQKFPFDFGRNEDTRNILWNFLTFNSLLFSSDYVIYGWSLITVLCHNSTIVYFCLGFMFIQIHQRGVPNGWNKLSVSISSNSQIISWTTMDM